MGEGDEGMTKWKTNVISAAAEKMCGEGGKKSTLSLSLSLFFFF